MCTKHYGRTRYLANRDQVLARAAVYRSKNREIIRERNAASYLKHRDSRTAAAQARRAVPEYAEAARRRSQEWRAANPDRFRESIKSYRERFPEKVAENLRRWHAANPEKVRVHRSRRKDHIRRAGRIDFTSDQLAARIAYYGGKCWMCRGEFEHLDHVKPLSRGGITALANLRPACARCNLSKKDRWFGVSELQRFTR